MSGAARLADLSVEITANAAPMRTALQRCEREIAAFGPKANTALAGLSDVFVRASSALSLIGVGAAAAGASLAGLSEYVRHTVEELAKIQDVAQRTGASAKFLQEFAYAVRQSGGEAEDAFKAIQKFSINLSKAASGSGDLADLFRQNGVAMTDMAGKVKPVEEMLGVLSDLMKGASSEADQMAISTAAFGKAGGPALVLTLQQGRQALRDLLKAADDAGAAVGDDLVQKAAALDDKVADLNDRISGLSRSLAVEFGGPALAQGLDLTLTKLREMQSVIAALRTADLGSLGKFLFSRTGPGFLGSLLPKADPKDQLAGLQKQADEYRAKIAAIDVGPSSGKGALGYLQQQLREVDKQIAAMPSSAKGGLKGAADFEPFGGSGYLPADASKPTIMPQATNAYTREIKSIEDRVRALRIEATTLNMGVREATAYRAEQDLLAVADEAKLQRTPELLASIKQQAAAIADQTAATMKLRQAKEDAQDELQRSQQIRSTESDATLVGANVRQLEAARYERERMFDIERRSIDLGREWADQQKAGVRAEALRAGIAAETLAKANLLRDVQTEREAAPMADTETVVRSRLSIRHEELR